jgi:hypothetical protein
MQVSKNTRFLTIMLLNSKVQVSCARIPPPHAWLLTAAARTCRFVTAQEPAKHWHSCQLQPLLLTRLLFMFCKNYTQAGSRIAVPNLMVWPG